ncbi:uncharacterized protein [Patagioenas fasciata]|uniref:uncharacterized protein n=1 Tax=Patagioenas fasciata TaxID=372321 RepID=UPI0032E8F457
MEVEDPSTRGALLTNTGKYAIPIINAEAYVRGKKEKPPFLPAEPPSSSSSNHDPVPEELLCLICKNITRNGAVYTERVRKQLWQQPPPLVTPPAALVTNAELSSSSSLPISSLSAEKDCQVPAPRQAALPHLLGPQGQSGPTTGPSMRARAMCSAGDKAAWELEKMQSKPDEFTNDFVKELMEFSRSPKERTPSFSSWMATT